MTSPEALIGKAAEHYASGNLKSAANLCRRVLKMWPRHAEALHLLGVVTFKAGNPGRATRYLADALAVRPSDLEITRNLAFALRDSDKPAAAAENFREVVRLDPNDIVSHFQLGVLLGEDEKHGEAIPHFDAVLEHDARNAQALYNRAKALLAIGRFAEAESEFAQTARLLPADYRVFAGWGAAFHQLERYEEARERYQLALDKAPATEIATDLLVGIGDSYFERGFFGKARAQYETALGRASGNAEATAGLAAVCERERDYQRSYDLVRPLAAEDPPTVPAVIAFAQVAPRFGGSGEAIKRLQAAAAQTSLRPHQNRRLHFALGKLHDAAGEFKAAFLDYQVANELYSDTHDPTPHTQITDQKIEAVSQSAVSRLRLKETPSDRPVFILGMPRSGTSLVEQILASHPNVAGGGELLAIPTIIKGLPGRLGVEADYRTLIERIGSDTVDSVARTYLDALTAVDKNASRVTDKLPHNFEHLWLIAAAFPGAPIIHCTRHPLDTCLSCYFQDFAGRHTYARNLSHLGIHYTDYRRLMTHWSETLDLNLMEVPYEDMVRETEAMSRNIVEFCGLNWDHACLKFHENTRFVGTASYDQVRRPVYAQSVRRYRNYEPHIDELKGALQVPAN